MEWFYWYWYVYIINQLYLIFNVILFYNKIYYKIIHQEFLSLNISYKAFISFELNFSSKFEIHYERYIHFDNQFYIGKLKFFLRINIH